MDGRLSFLRSFIYNKENSSFIWQIKNKETTCLIIGGHGGSNPLMRAMIFRGEKNDPLCQLASTRAGAMSIGIGIAANKFMAENRIVAIRELYDFMDND